MIYRYCVEIEADHQEEAEAELAKSVIENGWYFDLEGIEESEDDDDMPEGGLGVIESS